MSNIGSALNRAWQKVGSSFQVVRETENLSGEHARIKLNRQVTKPFIREFFLEGTFNYDTEVRPGDIVLTSDGRHLMVMNLTPDTFADRTFRNSAVLHKCNVSGELMRPSGEGFDDDYRMNLEWVPIKETCYGLMTEDLYGNDLETDEELGALGLQNHEFYVPASVGVRVHDRYQPVSGEYYRVESINRRQYANVYVCMLGEDTR